MGQTIWGGSILAQLLLEDSAFRKGLAGALGFATAIASKVRAGLTRMAEGFDRVGGRMVEQAERYTYLAGAIFVPIVLGMKSFADENAKVNEKIKAYREELMKTSLWEQNKRKYLAQQINLLQQQSQETGKAALAQKKLSDAFVKLKYDLGKLLWDALGPYVPSIINGVKASIIWIKTNQELAIRIVKLVAGFGALMAVLAPTFAIVGKVIRVFGFAIKIVSMLVGPVGILVAVFAGLYYMFKDQLDPIIGKHMETIKGLWAAWREGSLSTQDAVNQLGDTLMEFSSQALIAVGNKINQTINEWTGGWINKLVEDGFYYIIRAFDKLKAATAATWDFVVGKFEWAQKKITGAMEVLRKVWDKAVGHSWWTDSMKRVYTFTNTYIGGAAFAYERYSRAMVASMMTMRKATQQDYRITKMNPALIGSGAMGGAQFNGNFNFTGFGTDLTNDIGGYVNRAVDARLKRAFGR